MAPIPRDRNLDSTLALLQDGYTFISKRCRRYQSDIFETRLLLQKTICVRGEEAAKVFYDNNKFKRKGAAPVRLRATLFGKGGVQGTDGTTHRRRKAMFMSLMTPDSIRRLADLMASHWLAYIPRWEKTDRIVFFDEAQEILCRAVSAWAGVPLKESEVKRRTKDFAAMIEGGGAVGFKYWRGILGRNRAQRWIEDLVEKVRTHGFEALEGSALHTIAWHRDVNASLLDKRIAAVELINVLRPTVAVARFVTFAALALHEHPEWVPKLQSDEDNYCELFVQEVRRFYPFFPFVAARTRHTFEWKGYRIPKGVRVVLDLYGTDHDARLWEEPEEFRPERFLGWNGSAFNFIPQGGGDYYVGHRCAGEWITIELMKRASQLLTMTMNYDVPEQDLRVSLSTMPAIPKSRFVISNVR